MKTDNKLASVRQNQKTSNRSRFKVEELRRRSFGLDSSTFDIRHFNSSLPPNGGFVPDLDEGQSFVIKQIGGFVFQKFSAIRYQQGNRTFERFQLMT